MLTLVIFQLAVLVFSVVIHEVSHGYVADRMGDPTARLAGRLTLNPLKHLDPFGSFLLPLLLYFATNGALVFGWARPVPYNPYNLKDPLRAGGKIAAAGPLSNFAIAVIFGALIRFLVATGTGTPEMLALLSIVVYINILLGVFNLVPIPPLDGSKVLFALLPMGQQSLRLMATLERYGMIFLVFFIFVGFRLIVPIMQFLFVLITGQTTLF